ncbi:glycosyltransferase family 2 protein [Clostridium chromiireducens]|uniref:UDP-Glc:alpha-D-GlcNAc-diphosphoundecaprenol beta-1,3-glucosyltransferase WfgD n=1 Tax=Clostridium chromiireducens TaxID=225345 RepID=A0A1V4J138_9CLOT|nr:glycosyltransferase family A protein [Clostridium chromiireducens]OPJ65367.1 UDP-Glc:alpha-D-GlcNAc-diphosphoundecaprenol beta-1,3-glucosyltransferase WfgD [Clostridium chromiireducens]
MLKFSVVIPLYNKEKYLYKTIESVLKQTYADFELIIIDDGSTDNSLKIANSFNDDRIKVYKQANAGASAARNFGIKKAEGEFIAFIDGDDIWYENFLETIISLMNKYPNLKVYGTAIGLNDYEKQIESKRRNMEEKDFIIENYFYYKIKKDIYLTASSAVVKKEVFYDIGYFQEGLRNWEDLDMWARITLKYDVAFSTKICAIYQQNIIGSASRYNGKINADFFDYPEKYILKYNVQGEKLYYMLEYIAMWKIYYARIIHSSTNNRKESLEILKKYKYTRIFKNDLIKTYIYIISPRIMRNCVKRICKSLYSIRSR